MKDIDEPLAPTPLLSFDLLRGGGGAESIREIAAQISLANPTFARILPSTTSFAPTLCIAATRCASNGSSSTFSISFCIPT